MSDLSQQNIELDFEFAQTLILIIDEIHQQYPHHKVYGEEESFEGDRLKAEGAGGTVTDLRGNTVARLDEEINGLVVSNGRMYDKLFAALKL